MSNIPAGYNEDGEFEGFIEVDTSLEDNEEE